MDTLIFDAYNALRDLIATALPGVEVYDGPVAGTVTDDLFVVMGTADPTVDGIHAAAEAITQEWVTLGAQDRDENFTLNACIVATSGDDDYAPVRAAAAAAFTAVGDALRPPPHGTGDAMLNGTLNQHGTSVGWCGYAPAGLRQGPVSNGIAVYVPIAVACFARI